MKFCEKCGTALADEAVFCINCGCATGGGIILQQYQTAAPKADLSVAVKVFMIIGTVFMALCTFCIGLAWTLPMTISYCNKIKRGEKIGTGFKICSLLFVNTIAGILMLGDGEH